MTQGVDETAIIRKGRVISLVIAGSMLVWLALQIIGPAIGISGQFALLFDLAAILVLVWALVNGIQIWLQRRKQKV